ncbi:hypothetical protein HK096_010413, partial [Nowakowskiella sp. JEL0078]
MFSELDFLTVMEMENASNCYDFTRNYQNIEIPTSAAPSDDTFLNNISPDFTPVSELLSFTDSLPTPSISLFPPTPELSPANSHLNYFSSTYSPDWSNSISSFSAEIFASEEALFPNVVESIPKAIPECKSMSDFMDILGNPELCDAFKSIISNPQALDLLKKILANEPMSTSADYSTTTQANGSLEPRKRKITKLHICPTCSRQFTRRYNLETHILTHIPNRPRPFTCEECNKSFVRIHDLNRHKEIHSTNIGLYVCPDVACGRAFTRKDALRRHVSAK